jgi:hypothetical protein
MRNEIDLLSIFPHHELVTPAERLIMPPAFQGIQALYPTSRVNDPNDDLAIANGQYMFIRRSAYDGVGGIERVKDQIVEDRQFAQVVKGDGCKLCLADGRHLMTVRMYTSLGEIWEGWGKNIVLSFQGRPGQALLSVFGVFFLTLLPLLLIRWALLAWRSARASTQPDDTAYALWVTGLAGWNVAMPLAYRRRADKILGLPLGWTFTNSVGTGIIGLIMLYSLVRLIGGKGVTWKGRTYAGR